MPTRWPPDVGFYLDECLPLQVAEGLARVQYPISHPDEHNKRHQPDELLIPWLGQERLVWITKDDAAKRAHGPRLIQNALSVVWVRGLERERKNPLSTHDLFLMLATKLEAIAAEVARARGPYHSMVYMKSGGGFVLERVDIYRIQTDKQVPSLGRI